MKNAQRTLTVIIFLLAVLLAGISYLVKTYGIAATDPGQPGYQSVLSMLTAAVFGKGLLLLSDHRLHSCRSLALRQYRLRRFSASLPRHRAKQLPPARLRVPRAAARLHLWHRRPGVTVWRRSHSFRRCYRPAYPALCRRRFSGLHAFASRHGHALAEKSRSELAEERTRQWARRVRHRHHDRRRSGCEICRRRLDYSAFHSVDDCFFVLVRRHYHSVKVLTTCKVPVDAAGLSQHSHCGHCHRPLEQHHPPGNRICRPAFPGSDRLARRAQRALRIASRRLGALR